VSRDAVESSIGVHGRWAKRRGGTLPPHVMMYFVVAMAIWSDCDYEGVMRKLTDALRRFPASWDPAWQLPTSGGITQARQRLGYEPVKECFERVAAPVAGLLTAGAWCARWRMVSFDGMVFDLPDTDANTAEFGKPTGGAFPQARVVTMVETASHVSLGARISGVTGKGSGERAAAAALLWRLEPDMLLLCDAGFYSFELWSRAADTGAQLLWRLGDIMDLPIVRGCGDGSYLTLLYAPKVPASQRARLLERARAGDELSYEEDRRRARIARVVEYDVPDRGSGELICLLTTIKAPKQAPAALLADSYLHRWQHESANKEIKTQLRGPGKILRSKSPDMVRQEIYGYLLAHYAICATICTAATETSIDPDRVKFTNTVRIVADRLADPDAFSP
jgi:hypothetical protein